MENTQNAEINEISKLTWNAPSVDAFEVGGRTENSSGFLLDGVFSESPS